MRAGSNTSGDRLARVKNLIYAGFSFALLAACSGAPAVVATPGAIGFESQLSGWRVSSTGGQGRDASWEQGKDAAPVSPPNVLAITSINHSSEARFNLFWTAATRFQDGELAVAVRGDDGVVDQGGGPMWRVQDENNYYVCRFNPLEANYRVYVVKDGVRRQLATALAPVSAGQWHRVRVEHVGDQITCWLDGVRLLEARDATIANAGGVGLWTKADARTSFDDYLIEPR